MIICLMCFFNSLRLIQNRTNIIIEQVLKIVPELPKISQIGLKAAALCLIGYEIENFAG